jgi:hypothetical protein
MNRVESVYLVNAGSSVTFGGNTFNVSGGYTVIDTNVDYSTGAETGHLAAVDIDAKGPAGTVDFTLSGTPAFDVNLSPIWAEPTLPATVVIPGNDISRKIRDLRAIRRSYVQIHVQFRP